MTKGAQKHERRALKVARQEASKHGMTVELEDSPNGGPKRQIVLSNGKDSRRYIVACSPRDMDACVGFVRQWVRRAAKELKS